MKNVKIHSDASFAWRRWGKFTFIFLAIAVIFLGLVAYQITVSFQAAQSASKVHVQNLALVLESRLNTDFDAAQRNVSDMAAQIDPEAMQPIRGRQYERQITNWLQSQVRDISTATVLHFFDANGQLLYSNKANEATVNIADRDHFRQLKANPMSAVIFSDVVIDRSSHRATLMVAKAVHSLNGAFLGIAVAVIDLHAVSEQFREIELGRGGLIALHRLDTGAQVVRYPGPVDIDNTPAPDHPIRQAILATRPNGVLDLAASLDGESRLVGYRAVGQLPFFISVGIARQSYLAAWRTNTIILGIGALLFLLVLVITESLRSASEIKLMNSEKRFRTLIDRNNAVILQIDPVSGQILDANASACHFYGWSHAEICAMSIQDINQLDPEKVAAERTAAFTEQCNCFVFPHRLASGEIRTVEVHSTPIVVGTQNLLVSIIHDITQRLHYEQHVFELTRMQKSILNSRIVGMVKVVEHHFQWTNIAFCEMLGYTQQELLGQPVHIIHTSELAYRTFGEAAYPVIQKGDIYRGEVQYQCKGRGLRWFEISGSVLEQVAEGSIWSLIDITEHKQAIEQLRVSDLALKAVSQGVLISNADGLIISVNDAFMEITGFDKSEIVGNTCRFVQGPQTDPKTLKAIQASIKNLTDFTGEILNYRKDGTVFWNDLSISPVLDEQGRATHFIGITRDITERKTGQLALQASEALNLAILDSVPAEIAVVDSKGVILAVNEHWRNFALENGAEPGTPAPNTDIGTNYFSVCPEGAEAVADGTLNTRDGIQAVLDGTLPSYRQDYPCHSPEQERWFTMNVTPLGDGGAGAVITHTNHTQRRQMEDQVRQLAFHDALTQLPNRLLFNDRLVQTMAVSQRIGFYCALIFLDLDNFKPLNDLHGHDAGDLLLIEVARRLKACVRKMDTVARFGGDEFVVLLSELFADKTASTEQAAIIAEKIRLALSEPYQFTLQHEGQAPRLVEHCCSASIGVTLFVDHETSQSDILKWADSAMYKAKAEGRNRVRFHDSEA